MSIDRHGHPAHGARAARRTARRLCRLGLGLDAGRTRLVLGHRPPAPALVDSVALRVATLLTVVAIRRVRGRAALPLPHRARVRFAAALNAEIRRRHR